MSNHAALEVLPEVVPGTGHHDSIKPNATWKLGMLVLSGLPNGPAAWALRNLAGKTVLRGWISAESGRVAVRIPFADIASSLEIRSSSDRWSLSLPPRHV